MNRFSRQLLPAYIFTKPIVIGTYFWALLVHFADSVNNDSGNIFRRIIIITFLHLGIYGALYIAKQLLLDHVKPTFVPSLTLLALIVVGLSRGYLLENWLFAWEITQSLNIGLRMGTSLVNTVSSFSIAIIATASARSYQMKNAHLRNELERLESIKAHAISGIESVDNQAVEGIKAELITYVDSMQGRSVSEVLAILKEMIDKVVQPLSRRLENEPNLWTPPDATDTKIRVDWFKAFRGGLHPGKINYAFVPAVMIFSSLPTVLRNTVIYSALLYLAFSYGVGLLVGKVIQRLFAKQSVNYFLYFLVTLISGFVIGLSTLPMTAGYEAPFGFLILATIFYPITSSFISMVSSADEQLGDVVKDLDTATKDLEWNIARIREVQHQNYRNLARALHGSVQAKLASSYLAIEMLSLQSKASTDAINQLIAEIRTSIASINTEAQSYEDFPQLTAKIQQNWASVAQISFQLSDQDLKLITKDLLCAVALFDAIPELVFNAIKHGKASNIDISIGIKSPRIVQLSVTDNGIHDLIEIGSGLGTKILNESSLSWERNRHNGKTVTTAEFAFSDN